MSILTDFFGNSKPLPVQPVAPSVPGDQNNPLPYSSFKPGTVVSVPTYYSNGFQTYVLEPPVHPGDLNTPLLITPSKQNTAGFFAAVAKWRKSVFGW